MKQEELRELVMELDPVNVDFIMKNSWILETAERHEHYREQGNESLEKMLHEDLKDLIAEYGPRRLLPTNAKVGDGATICLYTDKEACTIIKVTKKTITVRRDKATLDPSFKPEFIPGGFAAHCTNQNEQKYTYEPDPNGAVSTFHWSDKYQTYGQPGNLKLIKGRHEFYDYNF